MENHCIKPSPKAALKTRQLTCFSRRAVPALGCPRLPQTDRGTEHPMTLSQLSLSPCPAASASQEPATPSAQSTVPSAASCFRRRRAAQGAPATGPSNPGWARRGDEARCQGLTSGRAQQATFKNVLTVTEIGSKTS